MPKIYDLEQSGPAWHEWRAGGLGGSDAPSVLGQSPWTSPDELMEQKLGLRTVAENARMLRGKRLEPEARLDYVRRTGNEVRPVCVTHDTEEWLRASLDGLSQDGGLVLEIKCPNYWSHWHALKGKVPRYYVVQIQHQLLATGAQRCHYFSYFPDRDDEGRSFYGQETGAVVEVLPDPEVQAQILKEGRAFWGRVLQYRKMTAGMTKVPRPRRRPRRGTK